MKLVIIENENIFKITEDQELILRYIRDNYISYDDIDIVDPDDIEELSAGMREKF